MKKVPKILVDKIESYKKYSYDELKAQIGSGIHEELADDLGVLFQIEVEINWEDEDQGTIRVAGFAVKATEEKWWHKFIHVSQSYDFLINKEGKISPSLKRV